MKPVLALLISVLFFSCNKNSSIEKPKPFISKDKMVDIIYDLSILQIIGSTYPKTLQQKDISPTTYIYTKYHIDSLQFAKNYYYYASKLSLYEEIYEEVSERLLRNKEELDQSIKNTTKKFYPSLAIMRIENDTLFNIFKTKIAAHKYDLY